MFWGSSKWFKKLVCYIYPLLCLAIPFIFYSLIGGESIILPVLFFAGMLVIGQSIYSSNIFSLISMCTYTIVFLVLFVIAPIYATYVMWGNYFYILPISLIFLFLYLYISSVIIVRSKYALLSIYLRKIAFLLIIAVCVLFLAPGFVSVLHSKDLHSEFEIDTKIAPVFGVFFWTITVGITLYKYSQHLFIFSNYKKKQYILYLRSFSIDNTGIDIECLRVLSQNPYGLEVMKIGAPSSLFTATLDYSTLYLEGTNWKTDLKQYINYPSSG